MRFKLGCFVQRRASNITIVCGENVRTRRFFIQAKGHGNRIEIGDHAYLNGSISIKGTNVTVRIGHGFDAKDVKTVAWDADITIGDGCLLAGGIEIRSGDIHQIFDIQTDAPLISAEPILIGDRGWIGSHVSVLKGAEIAADSVIGTRSVVTKKFSTPNVVLAGSPAKVVREGVRWER
ncbi:MAG: acyltransferase [Alphaproteobacteria bacterium]